MIKYKQGNLLQASEDIIAHGCNCVGGFGSGVAGQIAKFYPAAKQEYLVRYENSGWKLGDIQPLFTRDKWIVNCATQQEYFPRDKCHANYNAIYDCMVKLKKFAKNTGSSIAIPKIGAGLAGGEWDIIEFIINKVFNDYDITVYYL